MPRISKQSPQILDFTLLDRIEAPSAFRRSPRELVPALEKLPQTLARAEAASYFAARVSNPNDFGTDCDAWQREAYLRAALVEFVSIEYVLPQELKALAINIATPRIQHSHNPLLHVVAALRHMNVHLTASDLSESRRLAVWPISPTPIEFTYRMWVVQPLAPEDLNRRQGPKFASADVDRMRSWFSSAQAEWGVHNLVQHAIIEYSKFIVAAEHQAST